MSDLDKHKLMILRQAEHLRELKSENALLKAQLKLANLKLERRYEAMAHLPALLRVQAE